MYEISAAPRFSSVAAGGEHSLLLGENGSVFVCGKSENGRLGCRVSTAPAGAKVKEDLCIPVELPVPTVSAVAAGEYHSAIVFSESPYTVSTFGCGAVGQLGHGSSVDDVTEPRDVEYFAKLAEPSDAKATIVSLSLGDGHTIVALSDGSVHAFGNNESGALGLLGGMQSGFSKQSERYGFGVRGPSRAVAAPVAPLSQHKIALVSTGTRHSCFVSSSGDVFVSGDNQFGQLGLKGLPKSTVPRRVPLEGIQVRSVACGAQHTIILCEDGSVLGTGSNKSGELGFCHDVTKVDVFTPLNIQGVAEIAAGAAHTLFLVHGEVYGTGWGACGSLGTGFLENVFGAMKVLSVPGTTVVSISCSSHHSVALCGDGSVFVCGCNGHGQLGVGGIEAKQSYWRKVERVARCRSERRRPAEATSTTEGEAHAPTDFSPRCIKTPDEPATVAEEGDFVCFDAATPPPLPT